MTLCECGCGEEVNPGRRFIWGHNRRGIKVYSPMKYKIVMEGITQDIVRELFEYRDGNLYWNVATWSRAKIGNLAGSINNRKYRIIGIGDKIYRAHRLIFLYHHGFLPGFLDHIDGNTLNNSIDNLREATTQQNGRNRMKFERMNGKSTSSKYKGVYWDKTNRKWGSTICIDGRQKHLGYFTSEIEAAKTYDEAASDLFGEFANTNKNIYEQSW